MRTATRRVWILFAGLLPAAAASAGTLQVTATYPPLHANRIAPTSAVTVRFDRALDPTTVTAASFRVFGKTSGTATGTLTLLDGNTAVRLRPQRRFFPGEIVWVNLSTAIEGADGSPLGVGGHSFQFLVAAEGDGEANYTAMVTQTVMTNGQGTRLYGAQASDVDFDGWIDLVTVNEDTADVRVLMNRDDGTGLYHPVLLPTTPIGFGASPNEPADFDADGFADLATANQSEGTISVLLGHGDGSFDPEVVVTVGSAPRGMAVLDVDGDADLDIVIALYGESQLTLIRSNGNGTFQTPADFAGGSGDEWGLTAADMDEDGLADLVVGTRDPNEILVMRNQGNGTFAAPTVRPSGGYVWMVQVADLDGDRHADVMSANGPSQNGAILLGNGDGTLDAPQTHSVVGTTLATDFGDIDGDGDHDWMLSSYSGARWDIFTNDGSGVFTFLRRFTASQAGSCALAIDVDNDLDLDLALFDEEADEIQFKRNDGSPGTLFADRFEGGDTTAWSAATP